jgi:hypothetical protein
VERPCDAGRCVSWCPSWFGRLRNRKAYELTFRLPQVALDARPPLSTRVMFDLRTGNLEGYLNKLSRGGVFTRAKWEIRCVPP